MDRVANIFAGIVAVAMVTTVVSRSESAAVIRAAGDAFSGGLKAAMRTG